MQGLGAEVSWKQVLQLQYEVASSHVSRLEHSYALMTGGTGFESVSLFFFGMSMAMTDDNTNRRQ